MRAANRPYCSTKSAAYRGSPVRAASDARYVPTMNIESTHTCTVPPKTGCSGPQWGMAPAAVRGSSAR